MHENLFLIMQSSNLQVSGYRVCSVFVRKAQQMGKRIRFYLKPLAWFSANKKVKKNQKKNLEGQNLRIENMIDVQPFWEITG